MQPNSFQGRTALVTGGGGAGLGRAIADGLAQRGAAVVVADRDADAAALAADALRSAGGRAQAIPVDIRCAEEVSRMARQAEEAFGPIDILVNNAFTSSPDSILRTDPADWARDIEVILTGAFLCARAVLPGMMQQRRGSIVSVSSVNAHTYVGAPAYSAAKAGLESLSRSIAVEYAPFGIRSNVVVPGTFDTDAWHARRQRHPDIMSRLAHWYPAGRVGRREEIATAVLFLASDEASWITGAALTIDGGLLAGNPWLGRDAHPEDQPAWRPPGSAADPQAPSRPARDARHGAPE